MIDSGREIALSPHPSCAPASIHAVSVRVQTGADGLALVYRLRGDPTGLRWLPAQAGERRDELWRHTCCEAFLREPEAVAYQEWNFAPSGAWACYRFDDYRSGMAPAAVAAPPIVTERDSGELRVETRLSRPRGATPLRLALAVVIEAADGGVSYWALRHAPGRPDFHHPDNFALEL